MSRIKSVFRYGFTRLQAKTEDSSSVTQSLLNDDDYQYHEGGHSHDHEDDHAEEFNADGSPKKKELSKAEKDYLEAYDKLCKVTCVSIFFIAAQFTGGLLAGSIAIMCDTAHLATDMIGFMIGLYCLNLGR